MVGGLNQISIGHDPKEGRDRSFLPNDLNRCALLPDSEEVGVVGASQPEGSLAFVASFDAHLRAIDERRPPVLMWVYTGKEVVE